MMLSLGILMRGTNAVPVAIATSFASELLHHKLRTVRAIFIGWAVFIPGIVLFRSLLIQTANWVHVDTDL